MILSPPLDKVPIKSIYMIHGYDTQQTISAAKKIKGHFKNIKKYYFISFAEFIEFYKNNKARLFTKDLFCQSSTSNINAIAEISIGNAKFSKDEATELNKLLDDLQQLKSIIIIFIGGKLEKKALSSSWLKIVDQIGVIIFIKPVSKYFMQSWVKAQFAKINIDLTQEALLKFCELHHNDLSLAEQNIYKLSIIFNFNSINETASHKRFTLTLGDLLQKVHWLGKERNFTIFDLQRAMKSKNNLLIFKILDNLQEQSQENLLILWSIVQLIKENLHCIFDKNNNLQSGQHFKLAALLEKSGEIDLILKGVFTLEYNLNKNSNNYGYIWYSMLDLCLDAAKIIY